MQMRSYEIIDTNTILTLKETHETPSGTVPTPAYLLLFMI